jgi:hypothetical protein
LPQGSLKKIELQLLLPDLALQFRNPPLGGRKSVRHRPGFHLRRRRPHHLRWPTAAAQSRRSARAEPVSPNLQILPANVQLSR